MKLGKFLALPALLFGLNSCTTPRPPEITPLSTYRTRTVAHLLLEAEKYSSIYTPRKEDYLTLDRFLSEVGDRVRLAPNESEAYAENTIKIINSTIRAHYLTNIITPTEVAIKVPLFSEGVQRMQGHCMHHTVLYAAAAQEFGLPLSVHHAPHTVITNKGKEEILYGHLFMQWNFTNTVTTTGKKFIIFEPLTGEKVPDDYYRSKEDHNRVVEKQSLDEFTNCLPFTRLVYCPEVFGKRQSQTRNNISRSLREFFARRKVVEPNNAQVDIFFQLNDAKTAGNSK